MKPLSKLASRLLAKASHIPDGLMLTIFKKLFGKATPEAAPIPTAAPVAPSVPIPSIEVAHLSLAAILARLPEDLKPLINGEPEETATVALPMPTIMKQLPAGCVKMSLATLQRQAHGLLKALPPGDKRMVDVPLGEVFKHVKLSSLKRRPDQRVIDIPDTGYNLFADSTNPYALSPDDHLEQVQVMDLSDEDQPAEEPAAPAVPTGPRVLKMDDGLRQHFANTPTARSETPAGSPAAIRFELSDTGPRVASAVPAPTPAAAPIGRPTGPTLNLKLAALTASWPEDIRQEVGALDPETVVTLPLEEVGKGLSKGRVAFSWAQIRAWAEPAIEGQTAAAPNTALQLPLKFVAPAYLSASKKPKAERKSIDMDESIPSLFSDGREPEPAPPAAPEPPAEQAPELVVPEQEAPAAEVFAPAPTESEAPAVESTESQPIESEPAEVPHIEEQSAVVAEEVPTEAPAAEVEAVEVAPAVEAEAALVVETPVAAADTAHGHMPETVGELLGNPHKRDWTPAELVAGAMKLPGVAGAIVALQEGLQVAASLPEGVKSDVVAAFLPQIFARLNQYSGEMKLGEVDDLLFTTHGAHCQIYRLGYVYLAVLGKPGEPLPWHGLRLISEELARQTHK